MKVHHHAAFHGCCGTVKKDQGCKALYIPLGPVRICNKSSMAKYEG